MPRLAPAREKIRIKSIENFQSAWLHRGSAVAGSSCRKRDSFDMAKSIGPLRVLHGARHRQLEGRSNGTLISRLCPMLFNCHRSRSRTRIRTRKRRRRSRTRRRTRRRRTTNFFGDCCCGASKSWTKLFNQQSK